MNFGWLRPLLLRSRQFVIRNAPHILMGMGTTGSITALIFAAKATPAALQAKKDAEFLKSGGQENDDTHYSGVFAGDIQKLTPAETLKVCGRYYIPAAGMELFALMCFWGAHGLNMQRQALLAGCLSTAEQALIEYQRKTAELIGDKAEKEIRIANAQDRVDRSPPIPWVFEGDADCWCEYKGYQFRSSYRKLKDIQNDANAEMIKNMYLSESDLLWMFDPERRYIVPSNESRHIGWTVDRMMEFDILPIMGPDHQPMLEIDIRDKDGREYPPEPGFAASL